MKSKAEQILRKHLKPDWMFGGDSGKAILSAMEEYASQQAPASTQPVSAMEDGWVKVEKDKLERLYLIAAFDSYNRCDADDNKFLKEMEDFIFTTPTK